MWLIAFATPANALLLSPAKAQQDPVSGIVQWEVGPSLQDYLYYDYQLQQQWLMGSSSSSLPPKYSYYGVGSGAALLSVTLLLPPQLLLSEQLWSPLLVLLLVLLLAITAQYCCHHTATITDRSQLLFPFPSSPALATSISAFFAVCCFLLLLPQPKPLLQLQLVLVELLVQYAFASTTTAVLALLSHAKAQEQLLVSSGTYQNLLLVGRPRSLHKA